MARYKPYDYKQLMMVPVSLEDQLVPGTLEYAIHHLIEERVDTTIFDKRFCNDETGRSAYDPKVLLKIVLFGYSRAMTSSRPLERAYSENITFMALACGQKPDHSTIASFVSSMGDEISVLFSEVLLVCEQEGLLGGTHFSLDGLKLPSNASKEWTGTFGELRKKQQKLKAKVKEAIREHREADKHEGEKKQCWERDRREQRIKRLKRQADRIEKFLKENAPRRGHRGQEIKSNVTDNESAYMKTSHGMQQGYNAQALVDTENQIVMYAEASSDAQDFNNLDKVMAGAEKTTTKAGLGEDYFQGQVVSADSNYHSEKNLRACEDHKLDAYIPDTRFRKRDARFNTQHRHKPEQETRFELPDFKYETRKDCYVCPNGKQLKLHARRRKIGESFFRSYRSSEKDCAGCPWAKKCFKRPFAQRKTLSIFVDKEDGNYSQKMVKKIDTARGRKIYERRLAIVEPVFGNIRAQKRMDRFTLRGRKKVDLQWKLFCMVHNIEKILHFGQSLATAT